MYTTKVDVHQARKAAERLGKDFDKAPKAKAKTFAQALSSEESSTSTKPKGKSTGKATDKPEKANQYCNIMNLPGSKINNAKAPTVAAYAKSYYGLDLTEVSFLLPPPNKNNKTIIISSSKPLY